MSFTRVHRRRRLIPAHAGKTRAGYSLRHTSRAHPRSRGENRFASKSDNVQSGSSPLTRGKRAFPQPTRTQHRLIPAHAGKTWTARTGHATSWAHPRSRGENDEGAVGDNPVEGSSPLTRGKRDSSGGDVRRGGLIPAHAGKTGAVPHATNEAWAHPRSRGENVTVSEGWEKLEGSSPLTRGKRPAVDDPHAWEGLIPAHAGKTDSRHDMDRTHPAHPRSRGENASIAGCMALNAGSSPLTRGKPATRSEIVGYSGSSPLTRGKLPCLNPP